MKPGMSLPFNVSEIRERVILEASACRRPGKPWDPTKDPVSRQIHYLIITYVALAEESGIPPYSDMLPHMGLPGQMLYALFCEVAGTWEAFRTLVELSSSGLPRRTSRTEGDVVLHSVPERFMYRALMAMSGVTRVIAHPPIPGGSERMSADFLVSAATGRTAYVELAMISSSIAEGERSFIANYRRRLERKLELYQRAGLDPILIWSDEAAAPRMMGERLNDIRSQLGLPTRPPAPLAWYEEIV